MGGKKRIRDIGKNMNINIPIGVSARVFEKLGIDLKTKYIMDAKKAIFRFYNLSDPDLSISNPRKTLAEQQPDNAYGIPINNDELKIFMRLFNLNENDWFQENIGGRITHEILRKPMEKIQKTITKREKIDRLWVLDVLNNKKQIILYGPPGTGKTYNTKEMAVALLKGLPEIDLIEYEAIQEKNVKRKVNIDNIFFNRVEAAVKDLAGIEENPRSSMTGYYSVSKKLNKKLGLVWLSHPVKSGSFSVHLRKETDSKYPANITDQISGYKSNGWGGYPEFNIKDENDTKRAIELIKFAHENL